MSRAFRAELLKLRRRSVVVWAAVAAVAFAALTTLVTFLAADSGTVVPTTGPFSSTLESLARPEGATAAFADGIGFLGIFVLALFVTNVGFEYARGTLSASLMRQPSRLRWLAGKLGALLAFVAAALFVTEVATWLFGLALAPARGISTSAWFSASALGEAAGAYGSALFVAASWAVLGTTLAVLTRSVPIALGIGVAWAGPIEHITQNAWGGATRWFPGLSLEAFSAGGTVEASLGHAFAVAALYVAAAASVAVVSFQRRDVTT
jgi:ABC-2 type transport system permease protein